MDNVEEEVEVDGDGWKYKGCYTDLERGIHGFNIRNTSNRSMQPVFKDGWSYTGNSTIQYKVNMTQQNCRDVAITRNHKYFGLQAGDKCMTGNEPDSQGNRKVSNNECKLRCSSTTGVDELEIKTGKSGCGSRSRNDVYEVTGKVDNVPNDSQKLKYKDVIKGDGWVYKGCFTDKSGGVIINPMTKVNNGNNHKYSQQECRSNAKNLGMKFFGLRHGGDCYIGNTYANKENHKVLEGECQMKCPVTSTSEDELLKIYGKPGCGDGHKNDVYEVIDKTPPPYCSNACKAAKARIKEKENN
jgi:hypothetical protein